MASTPTRYQDGLWLPERETTVVPRLRFPFASNPTPDIYSKVYERTYEVQPQLFTPRINNRTAWANQLTYSEQIDNGAWSKTNATVSADSATAPDGQTTADLVLESSATGAHSLSQSATVTNAATEAFAFLKAAGRTWAQVLFTDSGSTTFSAFFDLGGGTTFSPAANTTAYCVSLGGGWFQCIVRFTPAAGSGTFKVAMASAIGTTSYAGDTTKGIYAWGAQVAAGSGAPYISTTSTTRSVSAPDREVAINVNASSPDPMAYLVSETDPAIPVSQAGIVNREFHRIPLQQIVPTSYLFASPNYPSVQWVSGINILSLKTYDIQGAYAVWCISNDSGTDMTSVIGYYGVAVAVTTSTGTPPTSITAPGHDCVIGSKILARVPSLNPATYFCTVTNVAGSVLTVTTTITIPTQSDTFVGASVLGANQIRRQTRNALDAGNTIELDAQVITNFYLIGVSPGISAITDIPRHNPFSLIDYLAAWEAGATWFNVQSSVITQHAGPILKSSYTQCYLSQA